MKAKLPKIIPLLTACAIGYFALSSVSFASEIIDVLRYYDSASRTANEHLQKSANAQERLLKETSASGAQLQQQRLQNSLEQLHQAISTLSNIVDGLQQSMNAVTQNSGGGGQKSAANRGVSPTDSKRDSSAGLRLDNNSNRIDVATVDRSRLADHAQSSQSPLRNYLDAYAKMFETLSNNLDIIGKNAFVTTQDANRGGADIAMLEIQSITAKRNQAMALANSVMQKIAEQQNTVAGNIGVGGAQSSGGNQSGAERARIEALGKPNETFAAAEWQRRSDDQQAKIKQAMAAARETAKAAMDAAVVNMVIGIAQGLDTDGHLAAVDNADIMSLVQIVMMQASKDQRDDIKDKLDKLREAHQRAAILREHAMIELAGTVTALATLTPCKFCDVSEARAASLIAKVPCEWCLISELAKVTARHAARGHDPAGSMFASMLAYQKLANLAAREDRRIAGQVSRLNLIASNQPLATGVRITDANITKSYDTALKWAIFASAQQPDLGWLGNAKPAMMVNPGGTQQSASIASAEKDKAKPANSGDGRGQGNIAGAVAAGQSNGKNQEIDKSKGGGNAGGGTGGSQVTIAGATAFAKGGGSNLKTDNANAGGGSRNNSDRMVYEFDPCGSVASAGKLAPPYWNGAAVENWRMPTQLEMDRWAFEKEKKRLERAIQAWQKWLGNLQAEKEELLNQIGAKQIAIAEAAFRCGAAVQAAQRAAQAQQAQQASSGGVWGFVTGFVSGVVTALGGPAATGIINALTGPVSQIIQAIVWGHIDFVKQFPDCLDVVNLQAELEGLFQQLAANETAIVEAGTAIQTRQDELKKAQEEWNQKLARASSKGQVGGINGFSKKSLLPVNWNPVDAGEAKDPRRLVEQVPCGDFQAWADLDSNSLFKMTSAYAKFAAYNLIQNDVWQRPQLAMAGRSGFDLTKPDSSSSQQDAISETDKKGATVPPPQSLPNSKGPVAGGGFNTAAADAQKGAIGGGAGADMAALRLQHTTQQANAASNLAKSVTDKTNAAQNSVIGALGGGGGQGSRGDPPAVDAYSLLANPCGFVSQASTPPHGGGIHAADPLWRMPTQEEIDAAMREQEKRRDARKAKAMQQRLADLKNEKARLVDEIIGKTAAIAGAEQNCTAAVQRAQAAKQDQQKETGGLVGAIVGTVVSGATGGIGGFVIGTIIGGGGKLPAEVAAIPECKEINELQVELAALRQELAEVELAMKEILNEISALRAKQDAEQQRERERLEKARLQAVAAASNGSVSAYLAALERLNANKPLANGKFGDFAVVDDPCADLHSDTDSSSMWAAMSAISKVANSEIAQGKEWAESRKKSLLWQQQAAKSFGSSGFDRVMSQQDTKAEMAKKIAISPPAVTLPKSKSMQGGGFNTTKSDAENSPASRIIANPCGTKVNPCSKPAPSVIGAGLLEGDSGIARQGPSATGAPIGPPAGGGGGSTGIFSKAPGLGIR